MPNVGSTTRVASRCAFGLLVPLLLGGCASLVAGAPSAIFDLTAPGEPSSPAGSIQILVPEPTTVRALDTDRIAARPSAGQYAYLPGAVWSDRLPKLLQARLVQTIQNTGLVGSASIPGQNIAIDYQLILDVRAFELGPDGAVAEFGIRLMDDSSGRVVRSRVFRHAVAVSSDNPAMVVWALDQAMDKAFVDAVTWALN